jgi:predicted SAM-dependent methyltransferase
MNASAQIYAEPVERDRAATPLCVNIGCGVDAPEGWYNIDNSPTIWISRLPLAQRWLRLPAWPRSVHRHDVLKGLPFGDASVDFIYSSHTFEHFPYDRSLALTKECFRALKPGGVLRIVVPDLGRIVGDYLNDSTAMASHRFIDRLLLRHTWQDFFHPGAHHCQMFDSRSLISMFREAGFSDAEVSQFGDSQIPDIVRVELESRKKESLYVEAAKQTRATPVAVNRVELQNS